MLSNPTSSLHARQRQHRRQTSTPTAFEGVKIPTLPNTHQRQAAHRRGLSLDIRRQQTTTPTARQDYRVSMNTNTGIATTSQHRVLREAQQQRIQARPGPHQHHFAALAANESENYLISPHGTPHIQRFDASCFDPNTMSFDSYGGQLNVIMQKNHGQYLNMSGAKEFELFAPESAQSTPTFMNFPDSPTGWISEGGGPSSRRVARRISNGIMDRVAKFETMGMEELQRPATPPNQNGPEYFPPTPMETPHDRVVKQEPRPDRFSDDYDESMEETIKPTRRRANQPAQTIFDEMRQQAEQSLSTASTPSSSTFPDKAFNSAPMQTPDYMSMNAFKDEFMKMEGRFDAMPLETGMLHSSSDLSQQMIADGQQMGQIIGGYDHQSHHQHFQNDPESGSQSPSSRSVGHRRTESVASIASAASIANINIEETRTETGVTMEEISQYIQGPETTDGKWTCLFDDCGKQFGRKENIKSHVQTHLNDRQYQCPTCKKCFVRQHDLKRHAKIHTGIKPYPCECGNSFARHDALTRHRQRGMCIGAFDGIVRKVVKRGRPKKNRPDMETRMEKSSRTRKKNMSISSISSQSGYSEDSSVANSPDNDYNMLDDILDMGMDTEAQKLSSLSSAPMPTMASQAMNEFVASPSAASVHSYVTPDAIMEKTSSHPASPAKSGGSRYNTPPDLSRSSSPPPAQFFDLDPNASAGADDLTSMATSGVMMSSASMSGTLPMGVNDQDDDLLLQFTNDDGLAQLDRDPSMMMMTKFDEEFDNTVSMFTNPDDVFFGGP